MNTLDPKTKQWKNLNKVYGETNEKIRRINQQMKGFQQESQRARGITEQLRRSLMLMFSLSQISGYIKKLVAVRGEFELQKRSLEAILQNKDAANEIWDKTVQLAIKSPFQIKELVSYTKQLAAYRVESDKLHDTTKMLADVSAGLGVDMQRLILAYGQVKAANYLRGTELRQFSEAGINILGELATYFSEVENRAISVGEVFQMVSKRMVSFADVEEVFKRITGEGGTFYNMQEIQAETLKGQISNLRDSLDVMLNDICMSQEGVLKGAVRMARRLLDSWEEWGTWVIPVLTSFLAKWALVNVISKRNIQMVKENSSSSKSLPKEERFVINMSSELIAYLCNDYSYRNPNRFSRLKALQDLLIRFQKAKLASKDMDVNIAQLVKAWGWSRPAVLAFVDQLQKYEILEVCNMVTSKVVHLKPSIFSSGLSPTPGG